MVDIDELFGSYLSAAKDFKLGQEVTWTIAKVEVENVGKEDDEQRKPVIYFEETPKGLVLNSTNKNAVKAALKSGDYLGVWPGKKLTLVCKNVEYAGKILPGIRVKLSDG